MNQGFYLLDENHNPYSCDYTEWILKCSQQKRIALDNINGCLISTVFLGIDHSFMSITPVLFEMMIFTNRHSMKFMDQREVRFTSYHKALAIHHQTFNAIKHKNITFLKKEILGSSYEY